MTSTTSNVEAGSVSVLFSFLEGHLQKYVVNYIVASNILTSYMKVKLDWDFMKVELG